MERKWTPKWYEPGDERGILELRREVFGDVDELRTREATWRWQFAENPAGGGIIRLAMDGGVYAGQYAVIPSRLWINGRETAAAFSCDTMTRLAYQKQGIFTGLARDVYARAGEMGINVVWGFPNDNSRPGFTGKLEWFDVADLPVYARPLRAAPLAAYFLNNRIAGTVAGALASPFMPFIFPAPKNLHLEKGGIKIRRAERAGEVFDALWDANKHKHKVMQIRDSQYLNWRYFGIAPDLYELFTVESGGAVIGYFVIRRMKFFGVESGVIVDLFPADVRPDALSFIMDFCAAWCAETKCAMLICINTGLTHSALGKNRFVRIPAKFSPKQIHLGARCRDGETAGILRNFSNWYVTCGDTDLV